jgi:gluconate 2-dehydrogenase gamma chain
MGTEITRRHFVKGTGIIVAGTAVSSIAILDACATDTSDGGDNNNGGGNGTGDGTTTIPDVFLFFNAAEAETIKSAFGRLIPGDTQDPGAVEAKAYVYLDRALLGYYQNLQQSYKRGIAAMDSYSQSQYSNDFASLSESQQDAVLSSMQDGSATGFYAPGASQFFSMLLKHVGEGMFCDPVYGGNNNLVGWKLIGYPGAQHTYANSDMVVGADQAGKETMTLTDLQQVEKPLPDSGF